MTETGTLQHKTKMPLTIMMVTSTLITMSLFYADEGFYNFSWMTNFGNWIIFFIYSTSIFISQILIHLLITKVFRLRSSMLWTILVGSIIAILLLVSFVFNWICYSSQYSKVKFYILHKLICVENALLFIDSDAIC